MATSNITFKQANYSLVDIKGEFLKQINPAASYLSTLSESGRSSMCSRLNMVTRVVTCNPIDSKDYVRFDWGSLRRFHYEQIMNLIRSQTKEDGTPTYSPSHLKTTWMALRKVAEQAWSLGLMDSDEFLKIKSVKFEFGKNIARGRAVSRTEVQDLIRSCTCSESVSGIRDAAIIALLFGTGMRRHEASNLKLSNIDYNTSVIRFIGKRNMMQERPIPDTVMPVIMRYIKELRGTEPGSLFCRIRKDGDIVIDDKGLTPHGIYHVVIKRVDELSIQHSTPHDFRRGLATFLLNDGVDIIEVRDILNHESISTTQLYVKKDFNKIRETVNRVSL